MPEKEAFFHYLPVSDLAIQWGVYLTGAGYAQIPPRSPYPPQGHPTLYDFQWCRGRTLPEFALLLISDGGGTFESHETGELPIQSGSIVLVLPGVWHRYQPHSKSGWTERWFTFNGELAHRLVGALGLQSTCVVEKISNLAYLRDRFDSLLERIHFHPAQNSIVLSIHALNFLIKAMECSSILPQVSGNPTIPANRDIDDELVVRAREHIWTQSHRQLSITQIARELGVTRRTLERRFYAATGCSLLEEITACRISRAKRLLAETDLVAKNVAYLAGFSSYEQMRVTFAKFARLSPIAYRACSRGSGTARRKR